MKIKEVCISTGLTDRAIRYYISENLISPSYTENYNGRKTFNFSEADVEVLNQIVALRRFDFSIEEIREIIASPERSTAIIESVKTRKKEAVSKEERLLSALLKLDTSRSYTLAELAEVLSGFDTEEVEIDDKIKISAGDVLISFIKRTVVFFVVFSPVLLSVLILILRFNNYEYPVLNQKAIIVTLLSFIPTVFAVFLPKFKIMHYRIIRYILFAVCILITPLSVAGAFFTVERSETTSFYNYREFDSDCLANRDLNLQKLFPVWPHYFVNEKQMVSCGSRYYYNYFEFMDYTYDIFAEWTLEGDEFKDEISRVENLFEEYMKVEKGDYTCLFICAEGGRIFEEEHDNYNYLIFAYNERNNKVRYIACCSLENGADQPYYLTLDW